MRRSRKRFQAGLNRRNRLGRSGASGAGGARKLILELLEEPRLEVSGADVTRCRDQCPDLAAAHEAAPTQLDALQASRPCPASDGLRPKLDVRGGQDPGGFGQRDPVGRRSHDQSAPEAGDAAGVAAFSGTGPALASAALPLSLPSPDPPPESEDLAPSWPVPLAGLDSVDSVDLAGFGRPGRRSFLAQPEPLKWIVGGLNALVRVPWAPQAGQALGPLLLMEWTTSVVLPQFEQM